MKRGSRTKPEQKELTLRHTEKRLNLFKFIYRHKQARSLHVAMYLGGHHQNVTNTLRKLRVSRPAFLECRDWQWPYGVLSRHFVYDLTEHAIKVLENAGYLNSKNDWVRTGKGEHKQPLHDLMVSDFSALLDIALKGSKILFHSWKEILERSKATDLKLPVVIERVKTSVTPDYLFSLTVDGENTCYAVEANLKVDLRRTDLKEPSIRKKFLAYDYLIDTRGIQKHFGMNQPLYLISLFNDEGKMNRSMEMLAKEVPKRWLKRFLFAYDPALGHPTKCPTRVSTVFKRVGAPDFNILMGGEFNGRKAQPTQSAYFSA